MRATSSASRTCGAWRSASVCTAMARIPSACSVRMTRRAISPRLATRTDLNTSAHRMPLDGAGHERVRAERAPEVRLDRARDLQQRGEVDAGLDHHLVQHGDDVLRGDVAGRTGRDGTAAELAEARLEGLDARLPGGIDVREPLPARVVEVRGELHVAAELAARALEEGPHLGGVRHPRGVAEADLLGAGRRKPARDREHPPRWHVALVGAAEADADDALAAQAGLAGAGKHALQ